MSRRRVLVAGGLFLVVLGLVIVIGRDIRTPLDPDGTGPGGTRALVLLLDEFGGSVSVRAEPPVASDDVAVLLSDRLDGRARGAVLDWVRAGGTLVVTDPSSPFVPAPVDLEVAAFGELALRPGVCSEPVLEIIETLEVDSQVVYGVGPGDGSCFGDGESAFVVVGRLGHGEVVAVGGAGVWTNASLGRADNAVLAAALAAPTPSTDVAVLRSELVVVGDSDRSSGDGGPTGGDARDVGGGVTSLFELLPDYLRWVVIQLFVAWLVYALARGRRLGRPVEEPQPVRIPGSEIVRATGRLLRRGDPAAPPPLLAAGVRADLVAELGLDRSSSPHAVVAAAVSRSSLTADQVAAALDPGLVRDDAGLVAHCAHIDHVRREVLRVRS